MNSSSSSSSSSSTTTTMPIVQLTPLLDSTPYLLAYALPLLFISLLLTFSGTFLTLDRSRSFPPAKTTSGSSTKGYTTVPGSYLSETIKGRKFKWILEGGIGGLAGGFAFGIHSATALALLIPATTDCKPLSHKSFLAIWVLSCIFTTTLAGRYRHATFLFFGISGGTLTALALCMITHPSLPSRIVLVGVFLPLFTVLLLITVTLPIPRLTNTVLHPLMRFCTASTGAFGIATSVALLMNPQEEGWANVWERLYLRNSAIPSAPWGTGKEQGLSTGYALFVVAGAAADWALRRWIGECPDEKWDDYLAQYAANLPNQADRAGTFQPLTSFWDRFFSTTSAPPYSKDILFPSDADMKSKSKQHLPLPVTVKNVAPAKLSKSEKSSLDLPGVPAGVELLRKKSRAGKGWKFDGEAGRKGRKPVKFGEVSDDSDEEDDADNFTKRASSSSSPPMAFPVVDYLKDKDTIPGAKRPWRLKDTRQSTSTSTTPTLIGTTQTPSDSNSNLKLDALATLDYDQEIAQLKKQRKQRMLADRDAELDRSDGEFDYSDYEEDLASRKLLLGARRPEYLQQRSTATIVGKETGKEKEKEEWSPGFLKRRQSERERAQAQQPTTAPAMPVPVPATPSLIRALDRLAVAQREAFEMAAAAGAQVNAAMPAQPRVQDSDYAQIVSRSASVREAEVHTKPKRERRGTGAHATLEDAEAGEGLTHSGKEQRSGETRERSPRWEEFWREVRVKAQS
ncbi:hypothetical protein D9613_005711 [Agrocybe pediades]|uniref:DUF4203 domain-containing protein n=1 Tax=Agrocybe pediades TaxID=84607 RepID=A0A8H4VNT8_9AGAR|nr:hypothetical protein D9613_005711 [Agrocybe pediades]